MITIISYGTGHGSLEGEPDVIFPLAHRFRDPHVSPEMREMTGLDQIVVDNVMAQPGAHAYLIAAFNLVTALYTAHDHADLLAAFSCIGGRHRSVAFARALFTLLIKWFPGQVQLIHRDVEKPELFVCADYVKAYRIMRTTLLGHVAPIGEPVELIHGDSEGADKMAARIWHLHGLGPITAFPYVKELGGYGGHARNDVLVAHMPELVLAFHPNHSPGTADAIARARKAGLDVHVYPKEN